MIAKLSKLTLLLEIAKRENFPSDIIDYKEKHDTVRDYLDYMKEQNIPSPHLLWFRKNFEGHVNESILFEYSKKFIDAIGKEKATIRFEKQEIELGKLEIEYLEQIT